MATHAAAPERSDQRTRRGPDENTGLLGESAAPAPTAGDDRRERIGFVAGPLLFLGLALALLGLTVQWPRRRAPRGRATRAASRARSPADITITVGVTIMAGVARLG